MKFWGHLLLVLVWLIQLGAVLPAAYAQPAGPERFGKLEQVLAHLGISDDPPFDRNELWRWDLAQTYEGFRTLLKHIDQEKELRKYADWDENGFTLYRDRDTKRFADFKLRFKPFGTPSDPNGLLEALKKRPCTECSALPLQGLRIALDPGHAGPAWERISGKFVKTRSGYVSEGRIALQTCLLLARELKKLGATVYLTRTEERFVTPLDYETFDLAPFAAEELLQSTDWEARDEDREDWADRALAKLAAGPDLFAVFANKLKLFGSESFRSRHFLNRADLAERAARINAFRPHLTLIVHYDAFSSSETQNDNNFTRGYIPGNVMEGELSFRRDRYLVARQLMDGHRWMESAVFTTAVVKGISDSTGVPLKTDPTDYGGVKVINGVYARNLAISRLLDQGAMAFLEVLKYDFTPEFRRLAINDRFTEIDGVRLNYPSRLDDIVVGIRQGILDYVRSVEKPLVEKWPVVLLQ